MFSVAMINTITKSSLGKERVYLSLRFQIHYWGWGSHSSSPSRNRSRNHVCLLACSLAHSLPSTAQSCLARKWYCPPWTVSFCIHYQSRHSITGMTTGQSDLGSASVEVPSSQAALGHSSMVVTRKVLPCPEFILAGGALHGPLISPLASLVFFTRS